MCIFNMYVRIFNMYVPRYFLMGGSVSVGSHDLGAPTTVSRMISYCFACVGFPLVFKMTNHLSYKYIHGGDKKIQNSKVLQWQA